MGQTLEDYKTELMNVEAIDRYWPLIDKELDRVPQMWQPYYTKEFLREAALSGYFNVWGVGPSEEIHLVVFTRILEYPGAKVLRVFFAFGNHLAECLPSLTGALEKLANNTECDFCEIAGRIGWEKKVPGFKRSGVTLLRPLKQFRVQ